MGARKTGALLAVIAAFAVAIFFIPYKEAGAMAPYGSVVLAMLSIGAILSTASARAESSMPFRRATELKTSAGFAVLTIGGNLATQLALQRISPGLLSMLQQTQILIIAAIAVAFLGERPRFGFWLGLVLAMGGLLLLRMPNVENPRANVEGIALGLGSSVCFALMHVYNRKVVHEIRPSRVNAIRLWLATLALVCVPGFARGLGDLGLYGWCLCAVAAVLGPFGARVMTMHSLRFIPAAEASLYTLITPVFAYLLGFAFFAQTPGLNEITGGVLVTLGVFLPLLARWRSNREGVPS